jgi:uncharacterized protein YjbJ (UPF0337 family)
MGIDDEMRNKAEDLKGRTKEAAGAATDNEELKAEGQADQTKAGLKDKLDDAKDKIRAKIDGL